MQIKKAKLMTHQKPLKHVNRRESVNDNVKKTEDETLSQSELNVNNDFKG